MNKKYFSSSHYKDDYFSKAVELLGRIILFPSTQVAIERGHPEIHIMINIIKESELLKNEIEKITDNEILFKNGSRIFYFTMEDVK